MITWKNFFLVESEKISSTQKLSLSHTTAITSCTKELITFIQRTQKKEPETSQWVTQKLTTALWHLTTRGMNDLKTLSMASDNELKVQLALHHTSDRVLPLLRHYEDRR
jgi:hypothetical protein